MEALVRVHAFACIYQAEKVMNQGCNVNTPNPESGPEVIKFTVMVEETIVRWSNA